MSAEEGDPLVGQVIDGRYRIRARLSEGGMGVVYRAEHVFLKRDVALKRLHAELTGHGQAVARFEREAQAAARIDHPNVCAVLDCGIGADGAFYLAMELLEGASLDKRIATGPLPLPEVVEIGLQLADALDRAHGLGIVHRDLKPENVMLVPRRGDPPFTAKIMDFGIAKVVQDGGEGRKLTQAGMIFGTPQYMAPEQAAGEAVDARADLYALGVVLFEMATGRCPFEAPTVSGLLTKHLTEPAPPLEAAAPGWVFPPAFRDLVARCLEKDPARRPASAAALGEALRAVRGLPALPGGPGLVPPGSFAPGEPPTRATGLPPGTDPRAMLPTMSLEPAQPPMPYSTTLLGGPPGAWRRLKVPLVVSVVVLVVAVAALVVVLAGGGGGTTGDAEAAAEAGTPRLAATNAREPSPTAGPPTEPAAKAREPSAGAGPATEGGTTGGAGEGIGRTMPDAGAATEGDAEPLPWGEEPAEPAVAGGEDAAERRAALAAERRAFAEGPEMAAALAAARRGRPGEGPEVLAPLEASLAGNAHFQFFRAEVLLRAERVEEAFAAAGRAVELEPRYAHDADLLGAVERTLGGRGALNGAATAFLERVLDGEGAAVLVERVLVEGRPTPAVRRVEAILAGRGLLDGVPSALRLPFLAVAVRRCPERKAVLEEMARNPEAAMAPHLRRFRGESGCGFLSMQDCFACERAVIREALGAVDAAVAAGASGSR